MLTIKVLGPGCPNCLKLEQICREVVAENKLEAEITKIENIDQITQHGVMLTPALIVNDKLLIQGKIPIKSTLANWLKKEAGL